MDEITKQIDALLEMPCYVIDFLPERVPKGAQGQFFTVENYWLNQPQHKIWCEKFVHVILKLMCYYNVSMLWNGFTDNPAPERIEAVVNEIMVNHSGTLHILLPDENALLVFEWDCLNLSVFNPTEHMKTLLHHIAWSEGLFFWQAET